MTLEMDEKTREVWGSTAWRGRDRCAERETGAHRSTLSNQINQDMYARYVCQLLVNTSRLNDKEN